MKDLVGHQPLNNGVAVPLLHRAPQPCSCQLLFIYIIYLFIYYEKCMQCGIFIGQGFDKAVVPLQLRHRLIRCPPVPFHIPRPPSTAYPNLTSQFNKLKWVGYSCCLRLPPIHFCCIPATNFPPQPSPLYSESSSRSGTAAACADSPP